MTKIVIVNEKNEVIGSKERMQVHAPDIYRTTGLWITNSKGEILLAQRSFQKVHDPGKWGPAVGGTVEENESYKDNIVKETEEEIGLTGVDFIEGPIFRTKGEHSRFSKWFFLKIDLDISGFKLQKEELEQAKWFSKEELLKEVEAHPERFNKSIPDRLKQFEG